MAYQTGSATSQDDLINKLQTFAVAQGWTLNIYSSTDSWCAINNGAVFVQFRWDASAGISMFHSLGFTGTGTAPGNQTGDSGSGLVDASAPYNSACTSQRRVQVGNGPFTAYHFFTDGTTKYVHVALEYAAGLFRHFGFGTLDKVGTWTGGEYGYGHTHDQTNTGIDNPTYGGHSFGVDGQHGSSGVGVATEAATVHVEGMPGQSGSVKWGVSSLLAALGNDRAGNARVSINGGTRSSPYLSTSGWLRANMANGYIPLIPIPIWFVDTAPTPDVIVFLGFQPDVRHIQIANLNPGDEFTVGSDTWKVFPAVRKQFLQANTEESWNMGIAYKKVP